MELTVGSLFSGIGGLDLGLERAGMRVIWQSEIDPYACKVLAKHWPEVVNHGNIKEINWQEIERPDVICGGYPCQPFSTAGKRRGEEDPRHLWPWVREAISQLRPRYAILENVRGHLSLGGLSVIGELASIGYDAEWRVVSAASVGANHRRDRIIIVAYPNSAPGQQQFERQVQEPNAGGCCEDVADSHHNGSPAAEVTGSVGKTTTKQQTGQDNATNAKGCSGLPEDVANANGEGLERGGGFQEQKTEFKRFDVFSTSSQWHEKWIGWQWWETEPDVGRVAYGVPSRVDRLRGLGNAVVPQVAEVIGRLVISDYQSRED